MNTEKPRALPGALCPYFRKDVSKVCHRCEMYEILPVEVISAAKPNGERVDHWGCTLKHQTFVLRDVMRGLAGLQAAEESFRNTAWKETQQNLHDIVETVKHQTNFNADVLRRVGDGMSQLAQAIDARSTTPQIAPHTNGKLLEQPR